MRGILVFVRANQVVISSCLMRGIVIFSARRNQVRFFNARLMHKIMMRPAKRHKIFVVRFLRKSFRMVNLFGGLATAAIRAPAVVFLLKGTFDFGGDIS